MGKVKAGRFFYLTSAILAEVVLKCYLVFLYETYVVEFD